MPAKRFSLATGLIGTIQYKVAVCCIQTSVGFRSSLSLTHFPLDLFFFKTLPYVITGLPQRRHALIMYRLIKLRLQPRTLSKAAHAIASLRSKLSAKLPLTRQLDLVSSKKSSFFVAVTPERRLIPISLQQ